MLQQTTRQIKRLAATGTISVLAGGIASAGWFCNCEVEHERPYYNPSCEPNWGFHETNWRRIQSIQSIQFGQQGSFCADGNYQAGMGDTSYQSEIQPNGTPLGPQQIILPAPGGQAIILHQQPQQYQAAPMQDQLPYSTQDAPAPVFSVPVYPQKFQNMQSQPSPAELNIPSMPEHQYPSQGYPNSLGVPLQIDRGSNGAGATSTLNPIPAPVQPPVGNTRQAPTPMPIQQLPTPMPSMPDQSGYYNVPMNTVSQQTQYYSGNIQNSAEQRFAPTPQQAPAQSSLRVPVQGISYGRAVPTSDDSATSPIHAVQPPTNPEAPTKRFSLIPRFWSRGN